MPTANTVASGSVAAANTFVGPIAVTHGRFDVGISGTFSGTVMVQRRPFGALLDSDYRDVEGFTEAAERTGYQAGAWEVRAGFKTGGYTSGTAIIDLRS